MSDWGFVGAAYGLAWTVLALYAVSLQWRLRGAADELRRAAAGGPGGSDDRGGGEAMAPHGDASPGGGETVRR